VNETHVIEQKREAPQPEAAFSFWSPVSRWLVKGAGWANDIEANRMSQSQETSGQHL
jgi:hypothetical protein